MSTDSERTWTTPAGGWQVGDAQRGARTAARVFRNFGIEIAPERADGVVRYMTKLAELTGKVVVVALPCPRGQMLVRIDPFESSVDAGLAEGG